MKSSIFPLFILFISSCLNLANAQNCVDSTLINPDGICFDVYMPVCGCNGVTYSNSCYAEIVGGVTEYTEGPCDGGVIDAEPCTDLAGVDFGVCAMYMGITIINGQCVGVSGCGWVVDGVNYETASYSTMQECQTCLETEPVDAEPCTDVADVDFGLCDMYMGITIVNGQCIGVSGCGWIVDDINYEPAFYNSMDECQACLFDSIIYADPCTDVADIDFGPCAMYMGVAVINGQCTNVSGCGWVVNGIDYSNAFYTEMADCKACLSSNSIIDENLSTISIYPNPVQDYFHVKAEFPIEQITIISSSGSIVYKSDAASTEISINSENWESGMYFVLVQTIHGVSVLRIQL